MTVDVQQEGEPVTDPVILSLIQTRGGHAAVDGGRPRIDHASHQPDAIRGRAGHEDLPAGGVRLRYVLVPVHAVDRIEFRGTLGVSEDDLRRAVVERVRQAPRRRARTRSRDRCRLSIATAATRSR